MPHDYADAMLQRLIDEARRALSIQDSLSRAEIVSSILQPYTGWALRWAIEDCRASGMSWQQIAGALGKSYPALLRQFEAGGPVYTVTPAHSASSGNFDAQTPLRRAATQLAQQMAGLAATQPDCMTHAQLREQIAALSTAQGRTDDPEPLLRAAYELIALAERIRQTVVAAGMSKAEREAWKTIDELKACYQRDRPEIEAAHQVLSALPRLADVPGFTRPLRTQK